MSTIDKLISRRFCIGLLAGIPLLSSATTVSSDVVGYVNLTISQGFNTIGLTLVKPEIYSGKIVSTTANSVTLSGNPSLDTTSQTYYLEVTESSSNIVGERIDIASVIGTVVNLNTTAAHNTISSANSFPSDTTVVIREHLTVGDFSLLLNDEQNSDNTFNPNGSDLLLFYENGAFRTHLLYQSRWYKNFGNFADITNKVIPPGLGFFYYRNPGAGTPSDVNITFTGSVRNNNYARKLAPGYQFIANSYPINSSPNELQLTPYMSATDNWSTNDANLILSWDKQSQTFRTHLLYNDNGEKSWYQNFGTFEKVNEDDILKYDDAVMVFSIDDEQVLETQSPLQ